MFTLTGELDETTAAFAKLATYGKREGITFGVADEGGVRSLADTTKIQQYKLDDYRAYVIALKKKNPAAVPLSIEGAWDDGKPRPIAPYGSSYHNYGAARDLSIVSRPAAMTEDSALKRLAELTLEHPEIGLRAGRYFAGNKYDSRHFELAVTLEDAKARYNARLARGSLQLGATVAGAVALYFFVRWWLRRRRRQHSTR